MMKELWFSCQEGRSIYNSDRFLWILCYSYIKNKELYVSFNSNIGTLVYKTVTPAAKKVTLELCISFIQYQMKF